MLRVNLWRPLVFGVTCCSFILLLPNYYYEDCFGTRFETCRVSPAIDTIDSEAGLIQLKQHNSVPDDDGLVSYCTLTQRCRPHTLHTPAATCHVYTNGEWLPVSNTQTHSHKHMHALYTLFSYSLQTLRQVCQRVLLIPALVFPPLNISHRTLHPSVTLRRAIVCVWIFVRLENLGPSSYKICLGGTKIVFTAFKYDMGKYAIWLIICGSHKSRYRGPVLFYGGRDQAGLRIVKVCVLEMPFERQWGEKY